MNASAVQFDDSPFVRNHGRPARGRGSWGFADANNQTIVVFFNGTFTDARKQARKHFAAQPDFSGVAVVCP